MIAELLTLVLGVSAAGAAQDFSWQGELREGQELVISNIIGEIKIEPASGRVARVTAVRRAGRYGDPEDVAVLTSESRRGMTICVRYPTTNRADQSNDCGDDHRGKSIKNDTQVDFLVQLPSGVAINAGTVSGVVRARNLSADAELSSVSGDVEVSGMRGRELRANTVSGEVLLTEITARDVSAKTVSGDVEFEGILDASGLYSFTTLSGMVMVIVPEGTGADYRATTFSGSIRVPEGATSESANRRRSRYSGKLGGGGADLNLESFSGRVEVRFANRSGE